MPIDSALGISAGASANLIIETRCAAHIIDAYKKWAKDNSAFTAQDLMKIVEKAIVKLRETKHINLRIRGGEAEIADKYVSAYFTEGHVPGDGNASRDFFLAEFSLDDYFAEVGKYIYDERIGKNRLNGKSKEDVCLLRVAFNLYLIFVDWLRHKWPNIYADFVHGEW